ncbi:unnamed protein product [Anisakis simplex]|uniref:Cadherin domain-containing protein n=1 Tax=Anisakis simplex TaxID=6269 RepID=A0A0M3J0Q9_ANISI|nr:unnamed protein product [Anisakis simplex]
MDLFRLLLRLLLTNGLCWAQFQFDNAVTQTSLRPSLHAPILKVTSSEGFLSESAEMGTIVRVSPAPHSESLQIIVQDADLVSSSSFRLSIVKPVHS